jgi:hypothetical protein
MKNNKIKEDWTAIPEINQGNSRRYEMNIEAFEKKRKGEIGMACSMRQCSLLKHYATSRQVAGSISDVIGFFISPNPSSRIMVLMSTQPLTEMSTKNLQAR